MKTRINQSKTNQSLLVTFYEGFTAYVMSWGEVYLFHDCGDGYDWGRSIERFPSVREFNKKFTL